MKPRAPTRERTNRPLKRSGQNRNGSARRNSDGTTRLALRSLGSHHRLLERHRQEPSHHQGLTASVPHGDVAVAVGDHLPRGIPTEIIARTASLTSDEILNLGLDENFTIQTIHPSPMYLEAADRMLGRHQEIPHLEMNNSKQLEPLEDPTEAGGEVSVS